MPEWVTDPDPSKPALPSTGLEIESWRWPKKSIRLVSPRFTARLGQGIPTALSDGKIAGPDKDLFETVNPPTTWPTQE